MKLSLYGKLLLLAMVLEVILIVIVIFGISGFSVMNIADDVRYAETIMIKCNHYRSEFSKRRLLKYKDLFHSNYLSFEKTLDEYPDEKEIQEVKELMSDYQIAFERYVGLMKKRGLNENKGVEGRFRKAVHNIEDIINTTNQYKIYVDMLQARRSEKDFIMRRKQKYIHRVENAISDMKNHTKLYIGNQGKRQEILELADKYTDTFHELVEVFNQLQQAEKELISYEKQLETKLEKIVHEKASLADMTQKIQISVAGMSIVLGIFLSIIMARSIARPVQILQKATRRIAEGDLDTKVEIKTSDEVGQLAKTFNNMVYNLKRSNDKVQEQQERLQRQNNELESLTGELQQSLDNLSILSRIGQSITAALNYDSIFEKLHGHLMYVIDSSIFGIGIYNSKEETIDYKLIISRGKRIDGQKVLINGDKRFDILCLNSGKEIYIENLELEQSYYLKSFHGYEEKQIYKPLEEYTKSLFYMPVSIENKILGVLCIESDKIKAYKNNHIDFLRNLASYVAIAIVNAQSYDEIKRSNDELKKTQSQLIQAEKLASLGQITTRIAHEIKNPLNFINNYSDGTIELFQEFSEDFDDMVKGKVDNEDFDFLHDTISDVSSHLATIKKNGQRIDGIVRSMMQHARGGTSEKVETNINSFIKEFINLAYEGFQGQYKSFTCDISMNKSDSEPVIELHQQEVSRVITNIVDNACYSMYKKSQENDSYKPELIANIAADDDSVEIKIRDNGLGIPKDVVDKVFNPFFTTKPTGEGTGLGLSLSYDIITNGHKGKMTIETEEGQFAEFCIWLPK